MLQIGARARASWQRRHVEGWHGASAAHRWNTVVCHRCAPRLVVEMFASGACHMVGVRSGRCTRSLMSLGVACFGARAQRLRGVSEYTGAQSYGNIAVDARSLFAKPPQGSPHSSYFELNAWSTLLTVRVVAIIQAFPRLSDNLLKRQVEVLLILCVRATGVSTCISALAPCGAMSAERTSSMPWRI